ncbi:MULTISPECIES: transposase [unclassified Pseudomonas]|uniref:transposase n=1 Tax=Pseudomonas sp. GD04015 TaxID=2975419 RepID=UPI00244B89FB|nr:MULTISPECIES: transposase [unclassified Pseudomonas]MDG9930398.1 transposase [Pseudomonas sp. GD04042]MDH0484489.1 transposase [Pseudomonas sp. GD04015]MDH0606053.1 transposase [Pseudomonas sp. GD03869]
MQRDNNSSACFYADEDYQFYLEYLAEQADKHGCDIHAWCLMTNHFHLLLTPHEAASAGLLMKGLGECYVHYLKRTYRRSGTLWEGRFRSCLVQDDAYLLSCYWSSYRSNAQAELHGLRKPHPVYESLGDSAEARATSYREPFQHELNPSLVDQLRAATNGNYTLGTQRFTEEVELALGRRVTPGKPGRPRKGVSGLAPLNRDLSPFLVSNLPAHTTFAASSNPARAAATRAPCSLPSSR